MNKLLSIFTEGQAPEKVDFFTKAIEWIKTNPVITGLSGAVLLLLIIVFVLIIKNKKNK